MGAVVDPVAIAQQVDPGARSDIDEAEGARSPCRHPGERGPDECAAPAVVGLHPPRLQHLEQLGTVLSADVDEQRAGVGTRPTVVHLVERVIESIEQQVSDCGERGQRQMRSGRCLTEQFQRRSIVGHRGGDAVVDRRIAAELLFGEPTPQIGEIVDSVTHPGRPYAVATPARCA